MNKSLLGAITGIALLAGCGDDDVSQYNDADIDARNDAVSETSAFTFEGNAAYCAHVTETPVYVTCLDIYADLRIRADNKLTSVYANIIMTDRNMQNSEQSAGSNEFLYQIHSSMCMRDAVVSGVEIIAVDEAGNQGSYALQNDCDRLEQLTGAI